MSLLPTGSDSTEATAGWHPEGGILWDSLGDGMVQAWKGSPGRSQHPRCHDADAMTWCFSISAPCPGRQDPPQRRRDQNPNMYCARTGTRRNSTPSRMFSSSRYDVPPPSPPHFSNKTNRNPPSSQRNLNNAFAYDLVPSPSVLAAALRAARRVDDYPTAVRVFEGMPHHPHPSPTLNRKGSKRLTLPHRHQSQGRKQGPVRAIPRGAQAPPRGARHPAQGGPLPRGGQLNH